MKELFEKKSVRILIFVLLILGISLFSAFYSYIDYMRDGNVLFLDDISFHLNRLQSIADGIKGGSFFVHIYPNVLNGYGYASPVFYPDLFLYPFALLSVLGVPTVFSFYLLMTSIFVGMGVAMFFFARKFLPFWQSVLSSCLYLVLQYSAADIINRAAIGESLALVFLPVVFLGLYNMTKEDFSKPWILLVGVLGTTYSHTISLYLDAWLIVVYTLLHAKTLFPNKKWWIKVGVIFGFYVLIGGAYLFPLAEMFLSGKFNLSNAKPWLNTQALSLTDLFTSRYAIGPFAMLAILLRLAVKKTDENAERVRLMDKFLVGSVFFVVLTLAIFPWKVFNFLFSNMQFPWRFNSFACPLLAIYMVMLVRELAVSPKRVGVVSAALIVCMLVYNVSYLSPSRHTVDFDYNYVGAGEWIPQQGGAWKEEDGGFVGVLDENGNPVSYQREENTVEISFESTGGDYRVALFYYKGYEAKLVRADQTEIPLEVAADDVSGMIVKTNGERGTVTVSYRGTLVQRASFVVSILSAVGGIVLAILLHRKQNEACTDETENQRIRN